MQKPFLLPERRKIKNYKKNITFPSPRNGIMSDNNRLVFCYCFSLFSDLRTMSGTALMYMLANLFLTQLFYVVGVGGVQVTALFSFNSERRWNSFQQQFTFVNE